MFNAPDIRQKKFRFKLSSLPNTSINFGGSSFASTVSPLTLGRTAEPVQLTPEEESKLMDRYERTVKDAYPVGHKVGYGDARQPTPEQLHHFSQNRDSIIKPLVKKDIKQKGGVFHGKHNVNRIFRKELGTSEHPLIEDTYDYDVWVGDPYHRADSMQEQLDKEMKCDIAYAVKQPAPHDARARWVVKSRAQEDKPEVDYVSYPNPIEHPYKTTKKDGIEYETLESAMAREEQLQRQTPMRYFKSRRNLEKYKMYKHIKGGI